MSTNTVICEAKDEAGVSGGVPQCLAYMGKSGPSSFGLFSFCFLFFFLNSCFYKLDECPNYTTQAWCITFGSKKVE